MRQFLAVAIGSIAIGLLAPFDISHVPSNPPSVMNPRRSYKGDRCTVRFRGQVPQWSVEALGVEWDDPARGKNDGSLDGVSYFECRVPGAGSFVKATRVPDPESSFVDAVVAKYVKETDFEEIKLSSMKTIETVGVAKIHKRQAQVDNLPTIALAESCISHIGLLGNYSFKSLSRLDLSANLLPKLEEVVAFASTLPSLRSLCLNDNHFVSFDAPLCTNVQELELARTLTEPQNIDTVLQSFPCLKSLGLAQNRLREVPPGLSKYFLEDLDLSHNNLNGAHIPELRAQHLNLAYNDIAKVATVPPCIASLELAGILLDWPSIDALDSITEVRFDHALSDRPYIIARLANLAKLNGSLVTIEERQDSELYTLANVMNKKHKALPENRWQQLVSKHGAPKQPPNGSIQSRLVMCEVDGLPIRIVGDASVRRLVHIAARRLGKPVLGLELWAGDDRIDLDSAVEAYTEAELLNLTTTKMTK